MERKRILSDDVQSIFALSARQSLKYYHSYTCTSHLFLALIQFLNRNKDEERYKKIYENIKNVLNKYEIEGKKLETEFLNYNIPGEKPEVGSEFSIKLNEEGTRIKEALTRRSLEEKRTMEIEDFITELFADYSFSIFRIFANITESDQKTEELRGEILNLFKSARIRKERSLDKVKEIQNINDYIEKNPKIVVNVEKEMKKIQVALAGKSNKNVILVGPAGCGKTVLIHELARRINENEVPDFLKNKIIYQLDPNAVIAGTRFRGDFEEKMQNILNLFKEDKDAICFIDEAHTFVNLGDDAQGANSAGNIFKPALSNGEIQMVLATTNEEYAKHIEPQKAFNRRFNKIILNEPTKEDTKKIIKGILKEEIEFFGRTISEELIEKIINLSDSYNLNQANPAKSIDAMEIAFAYSKVLKEENKEIDIDDIIQSIRLKYDIYVSDNKFKDTEEEFKAYLLGQDDALSKVMKNLRMVEKKIIDPEKPLFSMFLGGPSGVGKTETAGIIARKYFGDEKNLIKINMGEFGNEIDATKLLGAAPGFVGYDDETGLISQIKQRPNSVVLFDEIEKAHPSIFKIFLSLLDNGEVSDNKGNKISFRNAIIIFTSNLGYSKDFGEEVGIGLIKRIDNENNIKDAITNFFRPEFLGRLDDIIIFNNLTDDVADTLIKRYADFFNNASGLNIKFNKKDLKEIKERANIKREGARALKKAVKEQFILSIERKEEKGEK